MNGQTPGIFGHFARQRGHPSSRPSPASRPICPATKQAGNRGCGVTLPPGLASQTC